MNNDPYSLDLDEIANILHPTEAIRKMTENELPKFKLRCKVYNISVQEEADDYENILTEIANSMTMELIRQETTFNKFGEYIVALHWKEVAGKK